MKEYYRAIRFLRAMLIIWGGVKEHLEPEVGF